MGQQQSPASHEIAKVAEENIRLRKSLHALLDAAKGAVDRIGAGNIEARHNLREAIWMAERAANERR